MIENTTSLAEWPIASLRARKSRNSRVAYHHNPRYPHNNVAFATAPGSRPRICASRPSIQIHQQSFPGQSNDVNDVNDVNFWNFENPATQNQPFDETAEQDGQASASWQPSMISYNYPNMSPNSPLSPLDNGPSGVSKQVQTSTHHALAISWDTPVHNGIEFNPDFEVGSMSDGDYGKFGSFDSMGVSNPSTMASSISESYVMPGSNASFESPAGKLQIQDLSLDEYFHTLQGYDPGMPNVGNNSPISPAIQDPFPFDNESPGVQEWSNVRNMPLQNHGMAQWPVSTVSQPTQMQGFQYGQSSHSTQMPWNDQALHFDANANTGNVAFEPSQDHVYGAYLVESEFMSRQRDLTPQPAVSPTGDDSDGWYNINYPSSGDSSSPSQGSPGSAGSSPFEVITTPHQTPSPRPHSNDDHQHVFTLYPGIKKQSTKLPRGRQRALTTKEKKEAREVREAKACWACHLSKIKCSPCSPGSPCKKCAELIGKRRFCHLPCFNDPLESLYTFMVPDYLVGHFTRANVEKFVRDNATAWGSDEIVIRMSWGYSEPIEAIVVPLEIHNKSQIGVHHTVQNDGTNRPTLMRKVSPPLGIPLAAMDDMQEEYRIMLQRIVHNDLRNYASIAYDDQGSDLPEHLLMSLSAFYSASRAAGAEVELLKQVLEIHVVCTILERALYLDEDSLFQVESHLHRKYPPKSAARCVQRQVKLAFFEVQRKRIIEVLEAWGSLMWSSNKSTTIDKKWAMSFSVFLGLILAIDKTLGQGYFFCENNIEHHGAEATSERRKFQELVRLTQTELFERCKEIFHSSFKTRKNGKEACNPLRDGMSAFKGRQPDRSVGRFVDELQRIAREFGREIKSHRSTLPDPSYEDEPYRDAGRLACIFLDDFVDN